MMIDATLASIREFLKPDWAALNECIRTELHSDVPLVNALSEHIIQSGGKRIRPLLVLLMARAFSCQGPSAITLACIIEFIHTATLLHDDIVDDALLRRGQQTANAVFGNDAAVLVGDFLYSRAFQLMVTLQQMDVMRILAETTNELAQGEVLQLSHCKNINITETDYYQIIERKTAKLFAATTQLTAVVTRQSKELQEAMYTFGLEFGKAYQLIDDALDYQGHTEETGKKIGKDLEEGKLTLPLIYVLNHGNITAKQCVQQTILKPETHNFKMIRQLIDETGALSYTLKKAQEHATRAKNIALTLPASSAKDHLLSLVNVIEKRSS